VASTLNPCPLSWSATNTGPLLCHSYSNKIRANSLCVLFIVNEMHANVAGARLHKGKQVAPSEWSCPYVNTSCTGLMVKSRPNSAHGRTMIYHPQICHSHRRLRIVQLLAAMIIKQPCRLRPCHLVLKRVSACLLCRACYLLWTLLKPLPARNSRPALTHGKTSIKLTTLRSSLSNNHPPNSINASLLSKKAT
jgi:hypothetical protein